MNELFGELCVLAVDPFARESATAAGSREILRQRLVELGETDEAIAGGDFAACYACCEPGSDPDPFDSPNVQRRG